MLATIVLILGPLHVDTAAVPRVPYILLTYIHTYVHTYMHTCIHTYMHTRIHAHIHAYKNAYMHTHTHANIHGISTYTHGMYTNIRTCSKKDIHACIHTLHHITSHHTTSNHTTIHDITW